MIGYQMSQLKTLLSFWKLISQSQISTLVNLGTTKSQPETSTRTEEMSARAVTDGQVRTLVQETPVDH